jgi:hypothetical protein
VGESEEKERRIDHEILIIIMNSKEWISLQHLSFVNQKMSFTFARFWETKAKTYILFPRLRTKRVWITSMR